MNTHSTISLVTSPPSLHHLLWYAPPLPFSLSPIAILYLSAPHLSSTHYLFCTLLYISTSPLTTSDFTCTLLLLILRLIICLSHHTTLSSSQCRLCTSLLLIFDSKSLCFFSLSTLYLCASLNYDIYISQIKQRKARK